MEKILGVFLLLTLGVPSFGQNPGESYKASRTQAATFTRLYNINPPADGSTITEIVQIGSWLLILDQDGGTMGHGSILKVKTDGSKFVRWPMWDAATSHIATADTLLFGAKRLGGTEGNGLMFRTNLSGSTWTTIFNFPYNFSWPQYNFVVEGEKIYGSAYEAFGGDGYLFSLNPDGSGFTQITQLYSNYARVSFVYDDYIYGLVWLGEEEGGNFPARIKMDGSESEVFDGPANPASLLLIDELLYGITGNDGDNGLGTLWRMNPDGTELEILHHFTQEEGWPYQISYNGVVFYGVSIYGGEQSMGRFFRFDKSGANYRKLLDITDLTEGAYPYNFTVSGDTIYGLTLAGGDYGYGTIFKYIVSEVPPPPVEKIQTIALTIKKPETLQINMNQDMAVVDGTYVNLDTTVTINGNIDYSYEWKVRGNGTMNEIDNIVKITRDSTFYILATTTEGCTYMDSTTLRIKSITGIGDEVKQKNLVLYPNPNNGQFELRILYGLRNYNYEVLDVAGKVIYSDEFSCPNADCIKPLNLERIKMGTYTLILKQGTMILRKHKFIVIR